MKVTIFGTGNGGLTAAYHLSKMGHEICIYDFPEFQTQCEAVRQAGGIHAAEKEDDSKMLLDGFQKISLVAENMEEAMAFADFYVILCPSFAQERFFSEMIPWLRDNSTVLTMPANYAGLVFTEMLRKEGKEKLQIRFADAISIPWACRILEPGVTGIMGLKKFLPLSIFPADPSGKTEEAVRKLLPIPVEILPDPISAGLENINFGGHPLMTIVNMGLLENFGGQFSYYKDCCSPATARAAAKMDQERLAVGHALGLSLRTELDAMNALYGVKEESVYAFNRNSVPHGKIHNAPASSRARYITEDVPYVLVPCYELACLAEIEVPLVKACITIASAYNDEDYFRTGRTLEKMGLSGKNLQQIRSLFTKRGIYEK